MLSKAPAVPTAESANGPLERIGSNLHINMPGEKDQLIFEAGVNYFHQRARLMN